MEESVTPDEGTISYGDKEYSSFTIQQAKEIGIKMVHQELQILPLMNVEENIFIGEESSRRGFVNKGYALLFQFFYDCKKLTDFSLRQR